MCDWNLILSIIGNIISFLAILVALFIEPLNNFRKNNLQKKKYKKSIEQHRKNIIRLLEKDKFSIYLAAYLEPLTQKVLIDIFETEEVLKIGSGCIVEVNNEFKLESNYGSTATKLGTTGGVLLYNFSNSVIESINEYKRDDYSNLLSKIRKYLKMLKKKKI